MDTKLTQEDIYISINWDLRMYGLFIKDEFCEEGCLPANVVPGHHLEWETKLKQELVHDYTKA
jgi:hypothetical protein